MTLFTITDYETYLNFFHLGLNFSVLSLFEMNKIIRNENYFAYFILFRFINI